MPVDSDSLLVIGTHPVQYQAPVYRALQNHCGVPVNVVYGSDFSIAGYFDKQFQTSFAWDSGLTAGTQSCSFLAKVADGGASSFEDLSPKGLASAVSKLAPSAVLLTGYRPNFNLHAFFHAMRLGVPILFRAEATDHTMSRGPLKRLARDGMLRFLYSRCSRVLPIGRYSHAHYKRLGCSEDKMVFSPYCVDTAPFQCDEAARAELRPAVRSELGIGDSQTVILQSGKLGSHKGPHLLVEAVRRLPADRRRETVVVFLGDGPERKNLEELARRDPPVETRFLGFKNQNELSRYYHAADLLALPSRSETWGLAINEGLHHGLPCVVSDTVGCAPDLIQRGVTGEIAADNSVEDLLRALIDVQPVLGRAQTRDECRKKASGYTVERAAEGIATAYRSVLAQRKT